ncbi:primosomal protein N' [Campylobacter corcagiensis]|uniref:Replication restart protein PriA n=1 Tax=Campylobacter corcagiensis TaxID=1448857 RepID=A0A7M1LE72_9BACT|nr:primosomal protein N' [Campylobacter corcagiensis]QKF64966.1 primosomal protein N' [Campylobacter corcagiensis]QOQ86877.1 primosomal protein N' [Campylobacter corcagiensis]
MFFYKIAVLGSSLKPLTYASDSKFLPNQIVEIYVRNSLKKGVILELCQKPNFKTKEILKATEFKFSLTQATLANFIAAYYICDLGVAFNIFTPFKQTKFKSINFNLTPNLSSDQTKAYEFANEHKTSLIFGDTGSGKSEIYIKLIAKTLNQGKQALFLMPEISLTPQMEKRLLSYFGDALAIWHSKISPKKKSEILTKFESGEVKLIAGARSALFLPFTNLGLIVVDEEHDDSYKSAQKPRYNARDLSLFLASKFDIKVLLGSATPSLTTFNKQPTFRLKGTYHESFKEIIYDENETKLSKSIIKELKICLEDKKQAIVFLPTRANFKYMVCSKCSTLVKCPFCSVGMSYHKDKNSLKCHYCGYSTFAKVKCSSCKSPLLEAKRMGTSEVLDNLRAVFKDANIAKFDRDEITTQKKLVSLLKDFNDKKIDILVGTQMLSKGHDYHNVSLAVIMGIDENLNYADFRAREKSLALAIQLSGRAGRAGKAKVLIQTRQVEFFKEYILNYDKFLADELEYRSGLYPPFTKLLRILISHKNEKIAISTTSKCLERLKSVENIEIVGYGKAGIEYIASKFRYEILIRSKNIKALIKSGFSVYDISGVEVDMDPLSFA